MEMSLRVKCETAFGDRRCCFGTGFFFPPSRQCHQLPLPWRREFKAGCGSFSINAASGFPRRRAKKFSTRPWGSKGFFPRPPIGTSIQKRGEKCSGVKVDSFTMTVREVSGGSQQTLDVKIDADKEGAIELSQEGKIEIVDANDGILKEEAAQLSFLQENLSISQINQGVDNGNIFVIDGGDIVSIKDYVKTPLDYVNIEGTGREADEHTGGENYVKPLDYVSIEGTGREADKHTGGEDYVKPLDYVSIEGTGREADEHTGGEDYVKPLDYVSIEGTGREADEHTGGEDYVKPLDYVSIEGTGREADEHTGGEDYVKPLDYVSIERTGREADEHTGGEDYVKPLDYVSIGGTGREADEHTGGEDYVKPLDYVSIGGTGREADEHTGGEVNGKTVVEEANAVIEDKTNEEGSRLLKLELEANFHKQEIQRIAKENFSLGKKLFVYPPVVKPDQDIEVFFDRSLSTLSDEPEVLIMGAFNDWRWKSFTIRLSKTDLDGDWWSCQLYVPREAYKVDFVFFNGRNVYDNNDKKDFSIAVDGGLDALGFLDFLLEEKRKELEKLAEEQAERERQEEERRRMEAEKAVQEEDRSLARAETCRRREVLQQLIKEAVKSVDNVWYIKPSEFNGSDSVRLYYNRSSGPLPHANELWIHGGHNNWKDGLSIVKRLVKSASKDGDWWHADVVVPDQAFVLDWVFADGAPGNATVYDNNHRQDFHAIVTKAIPDEAYWVWEEQMIYRKLQQERRLREEALHAKAVTAARLKAETKERTWKRFLFSQKDIVFTEPLDVQAGSTVTVFYNPCSTNLNGKPEVWFRCSFNRWTHCNGPLQSQRMLPSENGSHVKASVKVPLDAYMMDFVFSEKEDGGVFDNKCGMDYHIPVFGGTTKEPPMHIVHIAVEMAPIAKVGGLGDVVTSLSRAVQDLNHNVDIVLPKYDCLNLSSVKDFQYHKNYFWGGTEIKVWHGKVEGLSVFFLEPQNGFFNAGCVYGCGNDADRFGFFCHAALEFLLQNGYHPDIIHCHDWSSAPVAWLFKEQYMHNGLGKARVVFTIHNLEFGIDFIGKAMAHTDMATTVSRTYSREVSGNPAIAPHLHKFHGIINGIDPDIWDPYNDKFIPVSYTLNNAVEGKRAAKEALQQRLGLKRADVPLVGVISRLTHQKGIHLIKHALWRTLERGGQVVLLGSAPDPRIQSDFEILARELQSRHHDRSRFCLSYDEPLSHLIYAGSDFILVPSIFEPCGLTQLIAMRYGSIPIVRKTGGLYDTVFDVDHERDRAEAQGLKPNGFSFDVADAAGVDYALNRAISAWYDGRDWFNNLCKRVMEQDWSWNRPALDYLELYHAARKVA